MNVGQQPIEMSELNSWPYQDNKNIVKRELYRANEIVYIRRLPGWFSQSHIYRVKCRNHLYTHRHKTGIIPYIMEITTLMRWWHFITCCCSPVVVLISSAYRRNSSCSSSMLIISIYNSRFFFTDVYKFFVFFRCCCFRAKVQRLLLSSVAYHPIQHKSNEYDYIYMKMNQKNWSRPWTLCCISTEDISADSDDVEIGISHIQMSTYIVILFFDYLTFQIVSYIHFFFYFN